MKDKSITPPKSSLNGTSTELLLTRILTFSKKWPSYRAVALIFLLGPGLQGCESFENKTISKLEEHCQYPQNNPCSIQLGQLFDGEWDSLYVFDPMVQQTVVDSLLQDQSIQIDVSISLVFWDSLRNFTFQQILPYNLDDYRINFSHRNNFWSSYGRGDNVKVSYLQNSQNYRLSPEK